MSKRKPRDVPSRDDYYMGLAFWIASKSKDPDTQVGGLIVSAANRPLGWGYNGPPQQIRDEDIDWSRPEKYDWVEHAEENAIDHSRGMDLTGSTLYVIASPCKNCMRKIVKAGIRRVVYFPIKPSEGSSINQTQISKSEEIAHAGHVQLERFKGNLNWMRDRMKWMESVGVFNV